MKSDGDGIEGYIESLNNAIWNPLRWQKLTSMILVKIESHKWHVLKMELFKKPSRKIDK